MGTTRAATGHRRHGWPSVDLACSDAALTRAPRLGLDLAGGTQIVLEPRVEGGGTVSQQQLAEARDIIVQRMPQTLWVVGMSYVVGILIAIPIGIITSLVGVPFFVFLIFTRARRRSA